MTMRLLPLLSLTGGVLLSAAAAETDRAIPRTGPYRVAVFATRGPAARSSVFGAVEDAVAAAGLQAETVNFPDMGDGRALARARFDCVILPESPFFPPGAAAALTAFAEAGGDLVLLGGKAFGSPVRKVGNVWLTREEYRDRLRGVRAETPVFAPAAEDESRWERGTNKPEHPSRIRAGSVDGVPCLEFDLRSLGRWQWDTFARRLPDGLPDTHNLLCLTLRGGERTAEAGIEIGEEDGSRWIAVVPLSPEWQDVVLTPGDFRFFPDGSPTGRGGKDDALRLHRARRISFGLATGITNHPDGDHRILVAKVGTAGSELAAGAGAYEPGPDLGFFTGDEADRLAQVTRVGRAPGAPTFPGAGGSVHGSFVGVSAVGFALAGKSRFTPLLSAFDSHDRDLGWAAGLLVNYGRPRKGSRVAAFGIESPDYYADPAFRAMLADILRTFAGRDLVAEAARDAEAAERAPLPLTTAPPSGYIRVSPDGKQFLKPDGTPLFLVGCNYLGPWNRFCGQGNARQTDEDFRRARDAGINAFRLWVGCADPDPTRVAAIRECARRYGIYLLLHVAKFEADGDAVVRWAGEVAARWRDEPMVLGYDLANEPYISTVMPMRFAGQPSPMAALKPYESLTAGYDTDWVGKALQQKPGWPPVAAWIPREELADVYAAHSLFGRYVAPFIAGGEDYSTLTGITGLLPVEDNGFARALNATFADWIDKVGGAIRKADPNHLVTVGYNTALSCLPCNEKLDFVSQHVYQKPLSYEEVMKNVTTMDRLAAVWPRQPVTLGEFGYSNGVEVPGGYLDTDSSAVGEMIHYLAALAGGHAGCMKWMLGDLPEPFIRDNVPWIDPGNIYEQHFGIYRYDGTDRGRPKPIAHAMRFLRETIDAGGLGGKLDVTPGDTPIGTAYVFRRPDALFIGDRSRTLPEISFRAESPTNLMLRREPAGLAIMSTADARVVFHPAAFDPRLRAATGAPVGRTARIARTDDTLTIDLLAGETVHIPAP